MEFIAKKFGQLSNIELYELLRARAEVFLLEQGIICQDLDRVDYDALHCFFWQDGEVAACLRAFCVDADTVKIGRVLTRERGTGLGRRLWEQSLLSIRCALPCRQLIVDAQVQAQGFYEKCGFIAEGEPFLEEGILHVFMRLVL